MMCLSMPYSVRRICRAVGAGALAALLSLAQTLPAVAANVTGSGSGAGALLQPGATAGARPYELPTMLPHTLVDQVGYHVGGDKTAILRGAIPGGEFEVRDDETGATVFTGILRSNVTDGGESVCVASFTALDEPGTYYLFNETLGESYSFRISEDIYQTLLRDSCKRFYRNRCGFTLTEALAGEDAHSACHMNDATLRADESVTLDVTGGWHLDAMADRDVSVGCSIMEELLLAWEMDTEVFTDDVDIPESGNGIPDILDEIRYEAEWLIKLQDTRSGGVYASAVTMGVGRGSTDAAILSARVEVTPVSDAATIAFAAALARFGYDYRPYDEVLARECIRAADRAFRYYEKGTAQLRAEKGPMSDTARFLAAALLYRATGYMTYRSVLNEYFAQETFADTFLTDDALFHGGVVYLDTRQTQDVAVCELLMRQLIRGAEELADNSRESAWKVCRTDDMERLLDDILRLRVADHVIYNYEYTTIVEDHLHYLMGRNPDAMNLVTEDTERTYSGSGVGSVLSDPVSLARFVSLLSVTCAESE